MVRRRFVFLLLFHFYAMHGSEDKVKTRWAKMEKLLKRQSCNFNFFLVFNREVLKEIFGHSRRTSAKLVILSELRFVRATNVFKI